MYTFTLATFFKITSNSNLEFKVVRHEQAVWITREVKNGLSIRLKSLADNT